MRSVEQDMKLVESVERRAADIRHRIEQNPRIQDTNGAILAANKMLGELELAAALRHWIEEAARLKKEDTEKADWINTVSWENRELESKLWDTDKEARRLKHGLRQITRRYKPSDPESMAAMIIREAKAYLNDDDRT